MRLFATALLIGAEIAFLLYLERAQRPEPAIPSASRPEATIRIGSPGAAPAPAPSETPRTPATQSNPVPIPGPYERVTRTPGAAGGGTVPYRIKSNDSLIRIAKRHGVDWRAIAKANGNVNPQRLKVGQVLQIPVLAKADPPPRR